MRNSNIKRNNTRLPLSGTEPLLDVDKWGTPKAIGSHNCYAHALDDYFNSPVPVQKQQPGQRAGLNRSFTNLSTCEIATRVLADNPGLVYRVEAETPCRPGHHKVFLFNDPDPVSGDYHLFRQVKDLIYRRQPQETIHSISRKFEVPLSSITPLTTHRILIRNVNIFSHKMGHASGALLTDSCGKLIRDPRKACRFAGNREYSLNCGAFCARSGKVKTRKDHEYVHSVSRRSL